MSETLILSYRMLYLITHYVLIFSIPIYVYKETNEPTYLGIVFALEWGIRLISLAFLSPFLEKNMHSISKYNLYQAIIISLLFLSFYLSSNFIFLIVIGIIASIFFDINFLFMEYFIQNISNEINLLKLQSKIQSIEQASLLMGPIISGFLIDFININYFFITISALYILYGILSRKIKIKYKSKRGLNTKNIIDGIKILYKKDNALYLVILTNSLNIIFGACIAIIPAIFLGEYNKTASYLGIFNFIVGLLGILSMVLFNNLMTIKAYNSERFFNNLTITLYVSITSAIFQMIIQNMMITISLLSIIIIMDSIFSIGLRTKRQLMFSSEEFRIVLPCMMLLNAISFPIGGMLIAIFVNQFSPKESIAIIGVISIVLFFLLNCLLKVIKGKNHEL